MIYMFKKVKKGEFSVAHDRDTRQRSLAVPNFQRLSSTQRSVSYLGPLTWNTLPRSLHNIDKLGRFKKSLKDYILDSY